MMKMMTRIMIKMILINNYDNDDEDDDHDNVKNYHDT
jgi:hypothetical protein